MAVKKLLRDAETGHFAAPDGSWTSNESLALNLQSPFDINRLRHHSGTRKLELLIKFADGSPARSFCLNWPTGG